MEDNRIACLTALDSLLHRSRFYAQRLTLVALTISAGAEGHTGEKKGGGEAAVE